jgi:putative hydrolase of the HAD superfamily
MTSPSFLIFDLDDTLYDERTYVRSGLRSVAQWAHEEESIDPEHLLSAMESAFSRGRSNIFDQAFKEVGRTSKTLVQRAVRKYRTHIPDIKISKPARECLDRFASWPKYLVTDGNKTVQNLKVQALGIEHEFRFVYLTYRYGHHHAKPSPHCFLKICEQANAAPENFVYIGDNPVKDFKGIKPLGFKTVRVLTGQHAHVEVPKTADADHHISDLSHLTDTFLETAWSSQ